MRITTRLCHPPDQRLTIRRETSYSSRLVTHPNSTEKKMAKAMATKKKKATGKQMEFPPPDHAAISKSQRVRDYIAQHKTAKTAEIVEALKEFDINKFNVANILYKKSNKKPKPSGKKLGRPAKVSITGNGVGGIESAIVFIRASGGIEAARSQLAQLAELRRIL
jgi:hypothetical protein